MTSEQRTSRSGGGYIKQRHSSQEGVDYDPFMDGVEIYKTPLGHSWLRRGRSYVYQTTSGHGAKHVQSSHVSPEEGCYNMSGSFRTDYHIDFTGSTTGTVDSSSGSAQLIIWRTTPQYDDMGGVHRVAVLCADAGVVALGLSSDYLQGRPRGYSGNGHIQRSFQYAVGDHKYAVEIHRSYR